MNNQTLSGFSSSIANLIYSLCAKRSKWLNSGWSVISCFSWNGSRYSYATSLFKLVRKLKNKLAPSRLAFKCSILNFILSSGCNKSTLFTKFYLWLKIDLINNKKSKKLMKNTFNRPYLLIKLAHDLNIPVFIFTLHKNTLIHIQK